MDEALIVEQREFLEHHHNASMTTVDPAGRPHAVPVLCALVDRELWSSGTERRARPRHSATAPVASLTVLPAGFWGRWLMRKAEAAG
jgi:Pyridoxamine 5'-phosphate oxidase